MKKINILLIIAFIIFSVQTVYSQEILISDGGTLTDCIDTLYDSGGSSGNYVDDIDHFIIISPTDATRVQLVFIDTLDIEKNDYLIIYDGPNDTYDQLAYIEESEVLHDTINSSGGDISLEFHASANTNGAGFAIQWQGYGQVTKTTTNIDCNGDYTGAIELDVSGAEEPFTYDWTGPDSYTSSSQNINNIQAGTYYLTATDNNNCIVLDTFELTQQSAINIAETITNLSCFESGDGGIDITVTGGIVSYTYDWTGTGVIQFNEDQVSLSAGTYYVTATDDSLCNAVDSFNITEPADILIFDVTGTTSYCAGTDGDTIKLDSSELGINYQLKKGIENDGEVKAGTGAQLFWYNKTVGTYTVEAINPTTTCTKNMNDTAFITENPLPTPYDVTGTASYCAGTAGVTVGLDNSEAGVSYQLYNNGGTNLVYDTVIPVVGAFNFPGTYLAETYTVVADNGTCTNDMTGSAVVTENPLPVAFGVTGTTSYCAGTGGDTVRLSSSETGINYQLKEDGNIEGALVAGTGSLLSWPDKNDGIYTVEAINPSTTCTQNMNDTAFITENSLPIAYDVTGTASYCAGTGGVTVGLDNSEAGVSYQLYNNNGTNLVYDTVIPVSGAFNFPGTYLAETYTVVADNGTCTNDMNESAVVTENPLPVAFGVTGTTSYCAGTGGDTVRLSSSETGINYQLKEDGNIEGALVAGTGSLLSWPDKNDGIYTVEAINPSTTCTQMMTNSAVITENSLPTAFNVTGTASYCAGDGGVTVGLADSDAGVSYQLYNNNGTNLVYDTVIPVSGAFNFPGTYLAETYTVEATDTATLCTKMMNDSAVITENPLPTPFNVTSSDTEYCAGTEGVSIGLDDSETGIYYQLELNGSSIGEVKAGTTGEALTWSNQTAGTYTVEATNPNTTCTQTMTGSKVITENALSPVTLTNDTICIGDTRILDAGAGYSYLWSTTETTQTISITTEGTYSVTITDGNNCQNDTSMFLKVNPLPTISLDDATICEEETYTFDAGDVFVSYLWSNGETTKTFDFYVDTITSTRIFPYSITVTDTNTCENSASMNLTVNPLPIVSITNLDETYNYQDEPVVVGVSPTGGDLSGTGITPWDYTFHPDLADTVNTNVITYSYTDVNDCTDSTFKNVDVVTTAGRIDSLKSVYCYYELVDTIFGINPKDSIGIFELAGGGDGLEDQGDNTAFITPSLIGAGTDTIIYTYYDEIPFVIKRTVTIDSVGNVDFQTLDTKYCFGDDPEYIAAVNLYPSGGSGIFSGGPTPGFTDNLNNTATLTPNQVTDFGTTYNIQFVYQSPNGCYSDTVTKPVTVNSLPVVSFILKSNYNILGEPDTLTGNHSPDGIFSGVGISSGILIPANAGIQTGLIINYAYTNTLTGCSNNINDTTDINESSNTIFNLEHTYCYCDSTFTITGDNEGLLPGTFTSNSLGITNTGNNNALYSLTDAGAGIDTVRFTYFRDSTEYWVDYRVAIDSIASVDFYPLDASYCVSNEIVNIIADVVHPNGSGSGDFSGIEGPGFTNNQTSAILNPELITPGNYDIKYVYTSSFDNSGCKDSITKSVTINSLPFVDFTIKATYSEQELPVILSGNHATGDYCKFSGMGITSDGRFEAPPGSYTISYEYTDTITGCSKSISKDTDILSAEGSITGLNDNNIYCSYEDADILIGIPTNGIIGSGTFTGYGITNIAPDTALFYPDSAGVENLTIRYTYIGSDIDSTVYSIEEDVEVNYFGDLSISIVDEVNNEFCIDHDPVLIKNDSNFHNEYCNFSGAGIIDNHNGNATFHPSLAGAGTHVIKYTCKYPAPSTCEESDSILITVYALPTPSFILESNYNVEEHAVLLEGDPSGGTFSGPGVDVDLDLFHPDWAGVGVGKIIEYEYPDSNGCINSTYDTTDVKTALGSISNLDNTYCYQDTTFTITGNDEGLPGFGTFTSKNGGITDNGDNTALYSLKNAGAGIDTVRFTYTRDITDYWVDYRVLIDSIGNVSIKDIDSSYCFGKPMITLEPIVNHQDGTGTGTGEFSTTATSGFTDYGISATIDPSEIHQGTYDFTYTYESSLENSGCKSSYTKQLTFHSLPEVSFSINDIYNILDAPYTLIGLPQGGTYNGTGVSNNKFYPSTAGIGPEFNITYEYEDSNTCTNSIVHQTSVQAAAGEIISPMEIYCYDDREYTLSVSPDPNGLSEGIFSGDGITNTGIDSASFNPLIAGDGVHTIRYTYNKIGTNDTAVFYIEKILTVDSIGEINFSGLSEDANYCLNDDPIDIVANPQNPNADFSGIGIFDNNDGTAKFTPNIVGEHVITLKYTSLLSGSSCTKSISKNVIVNDLPDVHFKINDGCIAAPIKFTFISTTPRNSIASYYWDFGEDNANSDEENPEYFYESDGEKHVSLTVITNATCETKLADTTIQLDNSPTAEYSWINECYGDAPVKFIIDESSSITGGTYSWDFDDNATATGDTVEHVFSSAGDYDVTLTITTENQCNDIITKTVHIKPFIQFSELPYYSQDFENGPDGWYIGGDTVDLTSNSSWEHGIATGTIINSDNLIWCTNLSGNYNNEEKSWITSPCFDFSNLQRPMIKLDIITNTQEKYDGAVLQYTDDIGENWYNIGTLNDGLNWFNKTGIEGDPGDQEYPKDGWSKEDTAWIVAKHDLNMLKGKTNVQFRIAFGSDAGANFEGFAFDNIWIGDRSRKVLFEHFTNSGDNACATQNPHINEIINKYPLDIIDIQYHTNYPAGDPMNAVNPSAPSARTLYYGIPGIPYSVMDGTIEFDYNTNVFSENALKLKVLESPAFDIELISEKTGNNLNVKTTVTALEDVSYGNITLYVAIIEKEIINITGDNGEIVFESVLRKMLPNPGGTSYVQAWAKDEFNELNLSWNIENFVDTSQLIVVAFMQDESTSKVMQAATSDTTTTGTDISSLFANNDIFNFLIYPNPSSGDTYIVFNKPIEKGQYLEIYNHTGILIEKVRLEKGTKIKSLKTSPYRSGIYLIKISLNNISKTKKLLIIN